MPIYPAPKPLKYESIVQVQHDLVLRMISPHLKAMMLEVQTNLRKCGYKVPTEDVMPVIRMKEVQKAINAAETSPNTNYALRLIAKYFKVYRLYQAVTTECY